MINLLLSNLQEESLDLDEDDDDDDVALLTKNFNKFLKKMGKWPKSGPKPPKGKNPFKPNVFANKNKGVQCRECDGFGHIQSEFANTLKKKKAMNTSWSDEDSKESQNEEEDLVGNVIFTGYLSNNVCSLMQKKTDYVAIETVHCYNNTASVGDVATLGKKKGVIIWQNLI